MMVISWIGSFQSLKLGRKTFVIGLLVSLIGSCSLCWAVVALAPAVISCVIGLVLDLDCLVVLLEQLVVLGLMWELLCLCLGSSIGYWSPQLLLSVLLCKNLLLAFY